MNNKFTTYLLYAVGEIVLVVVGILIAVSIDDWNEERKESEKVAVYKLSLIKDLKQDSIAMSEFLLNVEAGQNEFKILQRRLTAPTANLDTAFNIARYEVSLLADRIRPFNTNTISSLTSTGDINLFSEQLTNLIFELRRNQQLSIELSNLTYSSFWSAAGEFSHKLPSNPDFDLLYKGPLNEHIWNTTEREEIAGLLNKFLSARQNHYRISMLLIADIQEQTYSLINELRK